MEKVVLVNFLYSSHMESKADSNFANSSQIGLLTLNSIFNNNGIECQVVDLNNERFKQDKKITENYYTVTAEIIKNLHPDYIGFTAMANNFVNVILLSLEVHNMIPNAIIFLGGPQATAVSEELLKNFPHVDFVCIGESEVTVTRLTQYMKGNIDFFDIPSIVFRHNNTDIIRTKRADLISSEDFITIDYDSLVAKCQPDQNTYFYIEGGRGCPYRCVYCSTSTFWLRKFRIKPIIKLKNEIVELKKKFGIKKISIVHDLFTYDRNKLHEFCYMVKEENIEWTCSSRVDVLNEEDILLMKQSGCKGIFFGIETGSQYLQKKIKKGLDLSIADNTIKFAGINGIDPVTSFIIGFPFETTSNIEETLQKGLNYAVSGSSRVFMNMLTPEHGSEIMDKYHKDLIFDDIYYVDSKDSIIIKLQDELELIREYPQLFNYYYFIKNDQFDYQYLYFISTMFTLFVDNFKLTLSSLTNAKNIPLTDLFFQIADLENMPFLNGYLETFKRKSVAELVQSLLKYIGKLNSEKIDSIFELELIDFFVNS